MNIGEIFIRRPVMTTLVMMAIMLFGIIGYRLLPVNNLPNVDLRNHVCLRFCPPESQEHNHLRILVVTSANLFCHFII